MGLFSFFKKKDTKKAETEKKNTPKPAEVKPAPAVQPKEETKPPLQTAPKQEVKASPAVAPKQEGKTVSSPKAEENKKAVKPTEKPKNEANTAAQPSPKKEEKTAEKKEGSGFSGKFEIKKSKDGKFVFNLYAANSVIVATSQVYSSSAAAQNGIKSVIENAEKAPIEDQTLKNFEPQNYPKWEIYLDKGEQYRFRLSASNGSCVCHSQGYTSKASCKNGIESIIRTAKNAAIDKAYIKRD